LLLRPAVAVTLGIRAGVRDARASRPACLWTIIADAGQRRTMLRGGWRDASRLLASATGLDILIRSKCSDSSTRCRR
jgi:hypothetical protein